MSELEIYKFNELEKLVEQLQRDVNSLIACIVVLFVLFFVVSLLFAFALWSDKR